MHIPKMKNPSYDLKSPEFKPLIFYGDPCSEIDLVFNIPQPPVQVQDVSTLTKTRLHRSGQYSPSKQNQLEHYLHTEEDREFVHPQKNNPKNYLAFFVNILTLSEMEEQITIKKQNRLLKNLKHKPNLKKFNQAIIFSQGQFREKLENFFSSGEVGHLIDNSRVGEGLRQFYLDIVKKIVQAFRSKTEFARYTRKQFVLSTTQN